MIPANATLAGMLDAFRRHTYSPSEVVADVARCIEALDDRLGAFRETALERASEVADERTDEIAHGMLRGPLHGVPVAVKELFDVAGMSAAYGSQALAGRVAQTDAAAVRRLRDAGAIVVGITRSHEFGWGITTQHETLGGTANPYDHNRVPGGSSGGSAAAVAAGMVPVALGGDTGGSIRIPAAFCGVVGIKPTFGRVSGAGSMPLAPSFDTPGPIAREVTDLAIVLDVLAGRDPADAATLLPDVAMLPTIERLSGSRLVVCPDLQLRPLAEDHAAVHDQLVAALDDEHGVDEIGFAGADEIRPTFATIQMAEALHVHRTLLGTFPTVAERYGSDVRGRLDAAEDVDLAAYLDARARAATIRSRLDQLLDGAVLLLPVAAGGPSRRSSPDEVIHRGKPLSFRDLVMDFTVPANVGHQPAAVVPIGFDRDGLPVGLQVIGARGQEDRVLCVAAAVQRRFASRAPISAPQLVTPPQSSKE